jgi:formylglycine-generating enzyme required for sulfatase activity
MITISGATFRMGADSGDPDERPAHDVAVAGFQIDRFEVTNALFDAFAQATGYQTENEQKGSSQTWQSHFTPETVNNPVVVVSWNDAVAYCEWAGKRLPTEAEWEFAARGTDGRIYPWGNEYDPSKFNGKTSGIRGTVHVGSYPAGASAFGADDMAGNVWEWTADWYQAYPDGAPSSFFGEKFRVTRGGGWFDEGKQVRTSNRSSADPTAANDDLGFRCAK